MDPDDLAKLNQWFASPNPNGYGLPQTQDPQDATGASQSDAYWPDAWPGAGADYAPEDYARVLMAHLAMERGAPGLPTGPGEPNPQAGVGQPQLQSYHPGAWPRVDDGYTPEDHANVMLAAMGRAGGGGGLLGGGSRGYAAPAPSPAVPTVQDLIGAPDSSPMLNWGRQMADQGRGAAASPWMQDAPLQVPPGLKPQSAPPLPVGTHGYNPAPGDEDLLARMMFAESGMIPADLPAVGWSIVNRIGDPQFGKTLDQVRDRSGGFQIVPQGGGPPGGSRQWQLSADPSKLDPQSAKVLRQCQQIAHGILSGGIADPTSGGQLFFSSDQFDGTPETAPGDFSRMLRGRTIRPSSYQGHEGGGRRNYFFIKNEKQHAR